MKDTKYENYSTKFGAFIIKTSEGKARRMNSMTGKKEWKQVKTTFGFFKDYPDAVEFFVSRDGNNRYVSSSQGNNYLEWLDFLEVKSYDDALKKTNDEIVKCFQDYYEDDSIY